MIRAVIIGVVFLINLWSVSDCASLEPGINIYGISYHPDRKDSRGNEFKEWNPGLGYHLTLLNSKHSILFADGGLFLNSVGKSTAFSSAGAEWKLLYGISAGAFGALVYSPAYNSGKPVAALLPSVSYRHGRIRLNVTYIPKYKDVNRNSAFGVSLTWFVNRRVSHDE